VEIAGTATATRTITSVRYSLNGGSEEPIAIEPGTQVTFHGVVRGLDLGANEVEVRAYNGSDSPGQALVSFVVIDVSDPTVEITTPASEDLVPRDSVRIEGVARDDRGVATLQQSLDGAVAEDVEITSGEQVDFGFTLRPEPGEHVLVLTAGDGSGNSVVDTLRFRTAVARVTIDEPAVDTTLIQFVTGLKGVVDSPVPITRLTTRLNEGPEADVCLVAVFRSCKSDPTLHLDVSSSMDGLPQGESTLQVTAYGADGAILGLARTHFTVAVPVKHYRLTYLGTLGGDDSQGTELNEKDQVVGWAYDADGHGHAFVWTDGMMLDLGTSLGESSNANAINAEGVVVGEYTSDCVHPFRYTPGATVPETISDLCGMRAPDVSDYNAVLLWNPGADTTPESGFVLDSAGIHRLQYAALPPLRLLRINNRGQVLGLAHYGYGGTLYSTSAAPESGGPCAAYDLNDRGDISYTTCKGGRSEVILDDKTLIILPEIGRRGSSVASALNNHGAVAGSYHYSSSPTRPVHAFLWDGKETFDVEYGSSEWRIDSVRDLNDAGVILAHGTNTATGQKGAVLLHPLD
jgi:probable HAF family extracellular repeat protein